MASELNMYQVNCYCAAFKYPWSDFDALDRLKSANISLRLSDWHESFRTQRSAISTRRRRSRLPGSAIEPSRRPPSEFGHFYIICNQADAGEIIESCSCRSGIDSVCRRRVQSINNCLAIAAFQSSACISHKLCKQTCEGINKLIGRGVRFQHFSYASGYDGLAS